MHTCISLGIGLQLTNILRDVGEDLERGRIYLPLDEIHAFGLTEDDLFKCEVTPKYKEFMKFQISRARDYYRQAQEGIPMLAPDARFAVQASLDLYSRILDVVERNDYDNFRYV
jgi:phytoene synthase